jgi:DNA-binding response OmpR family regulator
MEVCDLNTLPRFEKIETLESELDNRCTASRFNSKNVACVVSQEKSFLNVKLGLESLGYEVACSSSLDETFKTVSSDPEDWAMIVVRLDQSIGERRLKSFVRVIRTMDVRVPILIMLQQGQSSENNNFPTLYADCVVGEPKSQRELSAAIQVAVRADVLWGSRYGNVRQDAINYLQRLQPG